MCLEKSKSPKVEIVILNWNGWKDTIECLESIYQINYPNYGVIIVDNGSENESIDMIRKYCKREITVKSRLIFNEADPSSNRIEIIEYFREETETDEVKENNNRELLYDKKLILIKNEKNYGFAEGNNIALRYAIKALDPNYFLLLNNDIVVDKDFLKNLVEVAEMDATIGMVGPKIYYYDFCGRTDIINFAGGIIDMWKGQPYHIGTNEVDHGQYDNIKKVDYVEGSAMLVKKDVLTRIGLIDPCYFAYWEENDFCMRGSRLGYSSIYVPEAKIWHKISSSVVNKTKVYYLTRNRFLFMKKYSTKRQYFSFLLYFFGFQFWLIGYNHLMDHKDKNEFIHFLRGVLNGIMLSDNTPENLH